MAFASLETQIADLTTKVNALTETYRTKAQAIDAAVTAALVAIPSNERVYYVDPRSGDDTGPGSSGRPMRTLKAACDAVPAGGRGAIYLPLAPVVCDIDQHIDLRHKSIRIGPVSNPSPSGTNADKALLPTIRQRIVGGTAYGFGLDCSSIVFVYCGLETATADTNPASSGLIRRVDVMGASCGVIYCDIRLGSTPFANRSEGAASLWLQVYGSRIKRTVSGRGSLLAAQTQPAVLGVRRTELPSDLTLTDLVSGLVRDSTGRVVNIVCSEVL
ncbi:hypothetical protein P7L68_19480 [Tistrella mobilis]|uniref:hypothetical protein n=1 Tax=Tistrella mobilis TaxID=171437 RepID=UPI003558D306